jgi:multiple sugar transport system substrate-binding protein
VIFRKSQQKEASWKLIEFLSRPQIQARFHSIIGDLPPRRSLERAVAGQRSAGGRVP